MTEETLAVIEGKAQKIERALEELALSGPSEAFHDDVYLNIRDGVVNGVVGSPGNVVLSYCTFTSHFDSIDVEVDKDGVEAILEVEKFLSYFGFATDGSSEVRLSFRGDPDDRLATAVEVTGVLNARLMLPNSESILDEIPMGLPDDFNDNDRYEAQEGQEPPVLIETETDTVSRIIEIVDYDPDLDFYPITVEDGEFALNAAKEDQPDRDRVSGSLDAHSVQSPTDFTNHYQEAFEEVFKTISGKVELQTAPTNSPMVILQKADGRVLRHMLGPVGQ